MKRRSESSLILAFTGVIAVSYGLVLLIGDPRPLLAGSTPWCLMMIFAGALLIAVSVKWTRLVAAFAISVLVTMAASRALSYLVTNQLRWPSRLLGALLWVWIGAATSAIFSFVVLSAHRAAKPDDGGD